MNHHQPEAGNGIAHLPRPKGRGIVQAMIRRRSTTAVPATALTGTFAGSVVLTRTRIAGADFGPIRHQPELDARTATVLGPNRGTDNRLAA